MSAHIVVVGSLNVDFVVNVPRFPEPGETVVGSRFATYPGGKGANQAYGAARLGGRVSMIGQVGNDAHAGWLKQHLASAGVDVSHVGTDPSVSTGVAVIGIEATGQNRIVIAPGSNGTLGAAQLQAAQGLIASADILLLQLEIPLPTVATAARLAKQAGAQVILDPAPALAIGEDLLRWIDYLTPNETELAALTAMPVSGPLDRAGALHRAEGLRARGARNVIVKMGEQGALLVGEKLEHFWPVVPVQAVDTTAAGDAFNAAFAVALAAGQSIIDAGRFAAAAAACSVTRPGAQPSMPVRSEVEALLNKSPQ
jgi:ribokinase